MDKRGRKLVDYDHAKHAFASAKSSSKKVSLIFSIDPFSFTESILQAESDPKVTKAFNELTQTETMYKEINKELLEVSRFFCLLATLQTY